MFDLFGTYNAWTPACRFLSTACILYESFKPIVCLINAKYGITAMGMAYMCGYAAKNGYREYLKEPYNHCFFLN